MVNFNPSFPDILGLEWMPTRDQKSRVWAGAPARMMRLRSTSAETITALKMSASVDTFLRASVPTLIDVVVEGNEFTQLPTLAHLTPVADGANAGWTRSDGSSSNLFDYINDDTTRWPNPGNTAQTQWIRTFTPGTEYSCAVDAAIFHTGGPAVNGRIYWVGIGAILGANTGFRKMSVKLEIGGNLYDPAGGATRDVNGFGQIMEFWWGEINPATGRPWTPTDIAAFRSAGTSRIRVRSSTEATASHYPQVYALSLNVQYQNTENRVAVGVYRRPEVIGSSRLINVTTDALRTMPGGTANWAKLTNTNYLFYWRQSVSPSEYGPILADDLRWNGSYQDLAGDGMPPGIVYPLAYSGTAPPGATDMASDSLTYDVFGRPQEPFDGSHRSAYALAMLRSDAANSGDSQPYRMDLADLVSFKQGSGTTGQRFTPASTQTYAGFRLPIIPPFADCSLTVRVHAVSGGAQVGGSFTITANDVGKIAYGEAGLRYLVGLFSSPVTLTGGTQYEIRLTSTLTGAGIDSWIVFVPDCSLAPTTGFGSTTSGAMINGSHQTSRDMCVNLMRQPDPPTGLTATVVTLPVNMPDGSTRDVEHVRVNWTAPASPLGASFYRYELERQMLGDTTWTRVANIRTASIVQLPDDDHLVARGFLTTYRIRAVARDGRISTWATSSAVTPNQGDYDILLTSNHDPSLEVVFDIPDSAEAYEFISTTKNETVAIHGADYQVVFTEAEDRGVGLKAAIEVNFGDEVPVLRAGQRIFSQLLAIAQTDDIPFVGVMDFQGTRMLGHVTPSDAQQQEPGHRYTASISVVPTYVKEVPVEVF